MKALLNSTLLAAALWTASGIACGAVIQWGQPVTGVQIGVDAEERPFKLGERIPLSVKFTNSTAMPRFPVGPIHLAGQISVMDARQQPVRRREDLRLEAQAKAGKMVGAIRKPPPMYSAVIKPNGVIGYGLDLAKEFALDLPGTYHVSAIGQVLSGMPFEPNSTTHSLTSAVVVVQVVPKIVTPPPPATNSAPVFAANPPPTPPTPAIMAAAPTQTEPPPRPIQVDPVPVTVPASASASFRLSRSLVTALVLGVLGLLALYSMFRPGSP